MSAQPPLRKPRHNDGRLMTEDEIRGLDGDALRQQVGVCVMGWRFVFWTDDVRWSFVPPWAVADPKSVDRKWQGSQEDFKLWPGDKYYDMRGIPNWPGDIAAAFQVDRPEWRWVMMTSEISAGWFVSVSLYANEADELREEGGVSATVRSATKPTAADHARARCIAALLLAAKIGK